MSLLRPSPQPGPLLRHPDLTPAQIGYAQAHPGELWRYRYHAHSPVQVVLTVLLPEDITEPAILTRQRLVVAAAQVAHAHPRKVSVESLGWWVEQCWSQDLLIIEHGLLHRHYGIVLA